MSSNRSQGQERSPSGLLFFALLLVSFSTTTAFADDAILSWIKSPEAYFATPEEIAQWRSQVVSPADAQTFIDQYWRVRGEAFRKEVRNRIEFADSKFGLGKIPGSRTAMGEVFMILGAPNEQKTVRGGTLLAPSAGSNPMAGRMQDSAIEQAANVTYSWIYKKDRLPPDLGVSELKFDFQTDVSRGKQTIDNPANVIPYLRRAATNLSKKAVITVNAGAAAAPPNAGTKPATPDPLWNVVPNLNGVMYTADVFVSPREEPFYAVSFFVPADAAPFQNWQSGLLVSLIRDSVGNEVVQQRQHVELQPYDEAGNRYVDRSYALAPGKYEAMFALYTPEGTTILASHREQFDVPAVNATTVSKLLLSSRIDTLATQDALDPFTFVAQKYAVRGDRRFHMSDKVAFFTTVANPSGSPNPQLMQRVTLTRDGQPFAKIPFEPAQLTQIGPNAFLLGLVFDAGTFKPGHYTVELQVRDFKAPEGSEMRTSGWTLKNEFDVVLNR